MEADQLNISRQHFPLSISLRDVVLQKYADPGHSAQGSQAMPREELLAYLRASENFELSPLETVLGQTEIIGDPALPSPAECAALRWTGDTFSLWEQNFPLEPSLTIQLRKLKPVIAMVALGDPTFFTPGAHPLHQMLDTVHEAATGWQENLGRAGQAVLKLIEETVEQARACLDTNGAGLADLARSVAQSAARNQSRADRMGQRAVETELGRLKAVAAKVNAAQMINQAMNDHPVPKDIGSFLSGPWYDSAQLVLLKFGEESSQWQEMSATTVVLLDSLQPPEAGDDGRRQKLDESVSAIPETVRRWLLSLQHDGDALDNIASAIEYAQARLMRGQVEDFEHVLPIPIPQGAPGKSREPVALDGVVTGQWYQIRSRAGALLRVQLTMMQDEQQQLLFCNQAGIKVQALDYTAFAKLVDSETATLLDTGASFSRALLAAATGIDTLAALQDLTGEGKPEPEPAPSAPSAADLPGDMVVRVGGAPPTANVVPESDAQEHSEPPPPLEPLKVAAEQPSEPDLPDSGLPELPMGTWLGFHDVDPPLLAKLALHDKVRQLLIFVNRKGVELRRLGEEEYMELLETGQVDIMEARNNFREQVEKARRRMQHHQT